MAQSLASERPCDIGVDTVERGGIKHFRRVNRAARVLSVTYFQETGVRLVVREARFMGLSFLQATGGGRLSSLCRFCECSLTDSLGPHTVIFSLGALVSRGWAVTKCTLLSGDP